jgi:hypothetical protein
MTKWVQIKCFPVKQGGLIKVLIIASLPKAVGERICKLLFNDADRLG